MKSDHCESRCSNDDYPHEKLSFTKLFQTRSTDFRHRIQQQLLLTFKNFQKFCLGLQMNAWPASTCNFWSCNTERLESPKDTIDLVQFRLQHIPDNVFPANF